eukprot:Hpha_TRINITY_DN19179_c0_g1::TRINITY_DN19179_c0_g1_i1::g.94873::m.94873
MRGLRVRFPRAACFCARRWGTVPGEGAASTEVEYKPGPLARAVDIARPVVFPEGEEDVPSVKVGLALYRVARRLVACTDLLVCADDSGVTPFLDDVEKEDPAAYAAVFTDDTVLQRTLAKLTVPEQEAMSSVRRVHGAVLVAQMSALLDAKPPVEGILLNDTLPIPLLDQSMRDAMHSSRVATMLECAAAGVAPTLLPPRLWREESITDAVNFLKGNAFFVVLRVVGGQPRAVLVPGVGSVKGAMVPLFSDSLSAYSFVNDGLSESLEGGGADVRVVQWDGDQAWRMVSTLFSNGRAEGVVLNPLPHTDPDPQGDAPPLVVPKGRLSFLPPPIL